MKIDLLPRLFLLILLTMEYAGIFAMAQTISEVPAQYLWPILAVPVVTAVTAFMLRRLSFNPENQ
jgi:hypothetical protein